MKKNHKTTIRINKEILEKLKNVGLTPQKIIDQKINRIFTKKIELIDGICTWCGTELQENEHEVCEPCLIQEANL